MFYTIQQHTVLNQMVVFLVRLRQKNEEIFQRCPLGGLFSNRICYIKLETYKQPLQMSAQKRIRFYHKFVVEKKFTKEKKPYEEEGMRVGMRLWLCYERQKFDINRTNVRLLSISYFSSWCLFCILLSLIQGISLFPRSKTQQKLAL